jgi:hypothetical protein
LILITGGVIVIWRNNARSVLLRPTTTAEQCNEALKLALQARGDKPSDPRIWRTLLLYAPTWTVMERAFQIRMTRREEQRVMRRERRRR